MALSTEQRITHYRAQRDGGSLTAKQRKRIRKQEHKSLRPAGTLRVSRVRKAYDRKTFDTNRSRARVFINAMRSGWFRPSVQQSLRDQQMLRQARATIDAHNNPLQDQSIDVSDGEVTDVTEVSDDTD